MFTFIGAVVLLGIGLGGGYYAGQRGWKTKLIEFVDKHNTLAELKDDVKNLVGKKSE
jgi:hypothetical protein